MWTTLEPVLAGRRHRDRMAARVPRILELAGLALDGKVADLGSGSGRLAIPLARAGRTVTAVDRHPGLLSSLAKHAEAASVDVEVVRRDLRSFERARAFDAVLLWGDTFGYYERTSDDMQVLQHALRSLKPGGRFVAQVTPRELATEVWPERTWRPLDGGRLLLEENAMIRNLSAVRHTWIQVDGADRLKFTGTRRLYGAHDIVNMLHKVGFGSVDCLGTLEGRPFGRHAETLIVVASP